MNNICKNCKHWERHSDYNYEIHGNFNSKRIYFDTPFGSCLSTKFVYTLEGDCPEDGLEYWDYEEYQASFKTGENFGCIHFTPRENI